MPRDRRVRTESRDWRLVGTVPRDWRMSSVVQCAILRLESGCVTVSRDLSVEIAMRMKSENCVMRLESGECVTRSVSR